MERVTEYSLSRSSSEWNLFLRRLRKRQESKPPPQWIPQAYSLC
jgi:hypothetical protein